MRRIWLPLALLMSLPCTVGATRYLIRPDGTGDYPTIQAAVEAASPGDSILLADGVFAGSGNRDIDLSDRQVVIASASGVPEHCIVDCGGSYEEQHHGFLCLSNVDSSTVLGGFTIRGAYAKSTYNWSGGGILCDGTSPTVNGMRFVNNMAAHNGGAICCTNGSQTVIEECHFAQNQMDGGKGSGVASLNAQVRVVNCEFVSNDDSAVYSGPGSADSLLNCRFHENWAEYGAGVRAEHTALAMNGCEFIANVATHNGGGIRAAGNTTAIDVTDTYFQGNFAEFGGGGLELLECAGSIVNCDFRQNFTYGSGGAVNLRSEEALTVVGCTLFENGASQDGGGIWASGNAMLTRLLIVDSTQGGGLRVSWSSEHLISCCNLYNNTGGDWTGLIWPLEGVDGNFSADPCFCDRSTGDLHLWNYSPCNQYSCGLIGAYPVACHDVQAADGEANSRTSRLVLAIRPSSPAIRGESVRIRYSIPSIAGGVARVRICDATGRIVRSLEISRESAEVGTLDWDGCRRDGQLAPSGTYFCVLEVGSESTSGRLVFLQ